MFQVKGKSLCYRIKRHFRQSCVSNFVTTISGEPRYECGGQVSTYTSPYSVYPFLMVLKLGDKNLRKKSNIYD